MKSHQWQQHQQHLRPTTQQQDLDKFWMELKLTPLSLYSLTVEPLKTELRLIEATRSEPKRATQLGNFEKISYSSKASCSQSSKSLSSHAVSSATSGWKYAPLLHWKIVRSKRLNSLYIGVFRGWPLYIDPLKDCCHESITDSIGTEVVARNPVAWLALSGIWPRPVSR